MRYELLIFLIVVAVAVIPLIQTERTGMQVTQQYDLRDYPLMFFKDNNFTGVISTSAIKKPAETPAIRMFVETLHPDYKLVIEERFGKETAEAITFTEDLRNKVMAGPYDYQKQDGIMIGTPCSNMAISELLEIENCNKFFKPGEAMVALEKKHGHYYLIVSGYDDEDLLRATMYFRAIFQERKLTDKLIAIDEQTPVTVTKGITTGGKAIYTAQILPVY